MKRLRIILILLVVFLAGALVIYLVQPKEPSYQGRTLSEWINDYDFAGTWPNRIDPVQQSNKQTAIHAIKEIGTNAVPTLLMWLKAKDRPFKGKLNSLLDKQTVIHFRFASAARLNGLARSGFAMLGKDGMPAVPSVLQLMNTTNFQDQISAAQCLWMITKDNQEEAEKIGVYKEYPWLKPSHTNTLRD